MKKWYRNRGLIVLLIVAIIIPHGFLGNTRKVTAAQSGTVTASTLNVRSEASTTSSKVQLSGMNVFLTKGDAVTILEESGEFYYISMKFNGKTVKGYVKSEYVKLDEAAVPTLAPTPKPTAVPTATPTGSASTGTIIKELDIKAKVTASSLNVRKGPGLTYAKAGSVVKNNTVTIISEKLIEKEKWYAISFKSGTKTKTGYVLSNYVKLNYDSTIKGTIAAKTKIYSKVSTGSAYLKNKSGTVITLKKNKSITFINDATISGVKWHKITFTVSGVKYTGYLMANQVNYKVTETASSTLPTAAPTAAVTPTPAVTPDPAATSTPTKSVTPTPKPTKAPTATPTKAPTPTPIAVLFEVANNYVYDYIGQPVTGYVCNTIYLNIVQNVLLSSNYLYDNNNQPISLANSQKVLVSEVVRVDGVTWYGVSTASEIYGYVKAEYIYIGDQIPANTGQGNIITPTPTPTPIYDSSGNIDFETQMTIEGFPESYKASLRALHAQYPQWVFKAYQTGLDWNTVIATESIPGKNLLSNNKSVEWKSLADGAYNWKTDTFVVYDGSTWVTASKAAVEYYMDPRNFITANGVFQFELLRYQSAYQNLHGVENILSGTALYNTYYTYLDDNGVSQVVSYGETFIKAAEYSGVSPYHLASRVKQEVVTGTTTLSNSVTGLYSGYEGLFNFYNIGANDSAGGGAVANGLKYALNGSTNLINNSLYMIPWTNQYRSIVGGSYFLGGSYINRGQDTIYLQKFNVTAISTFYHQYMTNVEAPYAEGKKILSAYNGMADSPIVFSIPVYLNMPASAVSAPTTMFNPNNRMKSLKVLDMSGNELLITPTFSQTVTSYDLIVGNDVDIIEIKATAVSKKATLAGGGYYNLNVGANQIIIPIVAENGDTANYIINIVRE
ncbi:MAG: SH3 domain-containing protein [Mobilitalea sp.]